MISGFENKNRGKDFIIAMIESIISGETPEEFANKWLNREDNKVKSAEEILNSIFK